MNLHYLPTLSRRTPTGTAIKLQLNNVIVEMYNEKLLLIVVQLNFVQPGPADSVFRNDLYQTKYCR